MAKITRSAGLSIYISSEPQRAMTVWALRDFLRAVDEAGIPDNATLSAERNHNTMAFTAVSVRHSVEVDYDQAVTAVTADVAAAVDRRD